MNRTQFITAVHEELAASEDAWKKSDVKDVLDAFESVVTRSLSEGEPINIAGFCKFARKDTPAKPERQGRNPATGETITLKPKPASVTVKITVLKKLKDTVIEAAAKSAKREAKKAKKKKGKKKK